MNDFWLPLFINAIAKPAQRKFVRQTRKMMAVQEKFLLTLLKAYEDTELGRKLGLREIKTIEQFRDRVPILPYKSYESYTRRIARGEQNILTPDPVVH